MLAQGPNNRGSVASYIVGLVGIWVEGRLSVVPQLLLLFLRAESLDLNLTRVRYHLLCTFLFKELDQVALNFTSSWPALSGRPLVRGTDQHYRLAGKSC